MIDKLRFLSGLCLLLPMAAGLAAAGDEESEKWKALLKEAWEHRLKSDPLFATTTGDHRFNDQLPRVNLAAQLKRLDTIQTQLDRWKAIDREALSANEQMNYDILGLDLSNRVTEGRFRSYLIPITNRSANTSPGSMA